MTHHTSIYMSSERGSRWRRGKPYRWMWGVAGAVWLAGCSTGNPGAGSEHATASNVGAEVAKSTPSAQPVIYTCPMHPSIRQDHPGKCPLCGMALQKVEPEESGEAAPESKGMDGTSTAASTIKISQGLLERVGFGTEPVSKGRLGDSLRVSGTVALDERSIRVVSARIAGRIERLMVNAVGTRVSRGTPLLELYSPQLLATQQEYLLARQQAGDGPSISAEGALKRLSLSGMSNEQLSQLKKGDGANGMMRVSAPDTGTVLEKSALEGAYVAEGASLYRLADLSRVWVLAQVPEQQVGMAERGTLAEVRGPDPSQAPLSGRVELIYPSVDPASRSLQVRIPLQNPGEKLLPGMSVLVTLQSAPREGLTVPYSAVVRTGEKPVVFVERSRGAYEPRAVTLGREEQGRIEILSGLKEGEPVVSAGAFLIDAQTRITGTAGTQYAGALDAGPSDSGETHPTASQAGGSHE